MVLQISTYVDPGVYIGEVVVPGAVNIATTPTTAGIIGIGDRTKRVTNEAVIRGLVEDETLTLVAPTGTGDSLSAPSGGLQTLTDAAALFGSVRVGAKVAITGATNPTNNGTFTVVQGGTGTLVLNNPTGVSETSSFTWSVVPHAVLAHRSDQTLQNTDAFRNDTLIGDNFLRYLPAWIAGTAAGTYDLTIATGLNTFCLEMDGITAVTIRLLYNAAPSIAIVGREIRVNSTFSGALGAAATRAQVAQAINDGLNAATALGFGPAYAAVARDITTGVQITSPVAAPGSRIRIFAPIANSGLVPLFGAAGADNRDSRSVLEISRLVYSSTAVYTVNYVDIDDNSDLLANTGVQEIIGVGSAAGIANYAAGVDYVAGTNAVDWGGVGSPPDTAPVYVSSVAQTFDVSTNDNLTLSFNGLPAVTIDLNALASPPLGYANPAAPAAATAAELAANINAVVGNNTNYGPRYNAVASAVTIGASIYVRLTSPTEGSVGSVTISAPAALSATLAVLGLQTTQLPYSVLGSGKRPALASVYFVTYTITRATSEYNAQKRFFSLDQARADLGPTSANNPLMIAMEIAFLQNAPSVVGVQVNDVSSPGSPTRAEFLSALNATLKTDVITDVIALTTDLAVQTDLKDHVEYASSPTVKRYRRGWFGMARNTPVGDKDTPDSYVYRARRTLQFAPDSPGRGRLILVAPPQLSGVSRDITLEDASVQRVNLDSTYLGVAVAAKKSSFTSPAASLARKTVTGFNLDDISDVDTWEGPERGLLAGQGTMVVTFDAGVFKILDPVTTEVGGGGLAAFSYPSTSSQKDNVTRKVDQALDANVIGIVPSDLSDFIVDVKVIIRAVLQGEVGSGAIGPFTNTDGTTRGIDLTTDIEVEQDPNDPTKFFFRYFFNLRYPALRLFGEFSVDNPFFASQAA